MAIEEKLDLIIAQQQNIIAALGALKWDSGLVGGEGKPLAPTEPEAASNPGKWAGTKYDPLNIDNIHVSVPPLYDSNWIGGKFTDWFKQDREAALRYYVGRYKVPLDLSKLAPSQRAALGL